MKALVLAASMLLPGAAWAADADPDEKLHWGEARFVPHLELRVRGELRKPVEVVNDLAGGGTSRIRLGLDAELSVFRLRTNLQDARVFGGPDDHSVIGDPGSASTGLYEASIEARASDRSYVRVGRQVVQWGEGRLVGAQDWSVRGRSLDAVRARAEVGKRLRLDALGALVTPQAVSFDQPDRGIFGALVGVDLHPLARLEALGLGRIRGGSAHADPRATQSATATGSLRVFGDFDGLSYSAEGALQGGHAELPTGGVPVLAYAAAARVSRKNHELRLSPEPELGASYASGDAKGSARYTQFDPILPNPIAYGLMDLVSWSNAATVHAGLTVHPHDRLAVTAAYRYLAFTSNSGDWLSGTLQTTSSAASTSRSLGHEVDLLARWTPHRVLEVRAGGAFLVVGQGARDRVGGGDVRPYGLLQVQLKVD